MADVSTRRGKLSVFGTLPGRAILIAAVVRLADFVLGLALGYVPAIINIVDILAAVVIAAAALYFVVRGALVMKRQLLWRVRRKLIISYFFIGLVPAILLVAFFSLAGVLLFFNFSAYLTRTEFREMSDRTEGVARTAAAEIERAGGRDVQAILDRRQATAANTFPGVSLAVVRVDERCGARPASDTDAVPAVLAKSGAWTHAAPPDRLPAWIECSGFRGLVAAAPDENAAEAGRPAGTIAPERMSLIVAPRDTSVIVRGIAFPPGSNPGYAVIADVPVNAAMKKIVRDAIGIEFVGVNNVSKGVALLHATAPTERVAASDALPTNSVLFLEYFDWSNGHSGTLQTTIRWGIVELYDRISNAPGESTNIVLFLLAFVGGLFLIIEVFALTFGFALAKSITGSVHELFVGTERVRRGDFTGQIAVKADDQLGELASSFNSMTASIEDLLRQAAEKKRLEEELRIAHEIQMSLLPQGPLSAPGMSITALCVPAREVGGDYYDVLRLSDDRIGLLIADVSGKGTSAALYMAELKGLMLSLSRIHTSPRELLIQANRLIAEHLDSRSFITMTYAVIDRAAGTMTYARAGHTPLIYVPGPGSASRAARILAPDGLVVGLKIDNGERFEALLQEETIRLRPGDVYLFFTDGITEAMNAADDFYGDPRLARLVEQHADLPAEELRERVLRDIAVFVGDAPQHDDMTMILLKIEEAPARREAIA
ncbi:MAG TPA: PP2C family protein-serine/threonine phosphatase [Vicinamibacterales bacterium]|jgi:sigma-B regulation protein RsbU (phosphoserine phosphatase)|nr:PP2C family protein-serine/threonine phosphatase [Vicinamibacterales bacterium]